MNKDFEKDYKRLSELEPTRFQLLEYGLALQSLAEGLTEHGVWNMFRKVETAQRYLSEFKGHFVTTPELNEAEAEIASALHTYMRKCMDCPLGTTLYRMIAENRGLPVWYAFVKSLVANKRNYRDALQDASHQFELDKTTDNLLMLNALQMWDDYDFPDAHDWLQLCGK